MTNATTLTRHQLIRRGEKLEYFTIVWNSLEALVSIVAGVIAGSVSLVFSIKGRCFDRTGTRTVPVDSIRQILKSEPTTVEFIGERPCT
jgi:hypothetical protein